jgi:hypothetical protein
VLFVDAEHVGRRRGVGLQVVVELETVELAEVARLIDAEDNGFSKSIEESEDWVGDVSWKFQGPIACFAGSSRVSLPMPWWPPRTTA